MINKPVFDPNRLVKHFFVFLIFIIIPSSSISTYKEITPVLTVSENRRFLSTKTGDPFFWLGDTGWLLFTKLTREEAEKYLEDRRLKGFNVIQVMVLHNVKNTFNIYGDSALIDNRIDQPDITPGNSFDDSLQYDYWDNIDHIVDLAGKKGLYMALVPVWGSNVRSGLVTREQAKKYGEWIAKSIPQGLHDTTQPYWTDDDVRRYAYWSVFAGCCGFTYGHNAVMQFYKPEDKQPAYGAKIYWDVAINAPGASQMKYLKQLILSKPYFERVPVEELLATKQGEKSLIHPERRNLATTGF